MQGIKNIKLLDLDVNFDVSVVTRETTAKILTAIAEFLAFHRNQIPFVYQTFQFMVERIMKFEPSEDWNNFHIEQQRALAQSTLQYFNLLRKRILNTLSSVEIAQALFVFGSTSTTPKEAFIIKLPSINDNHYAKNHINSDMCLVRNITSSINESQELYEHNSQLGATNMFMYLCPRSPGAAIDLEHFVKLENYELPLHSCKTTVFNLRNISEEQYTNCCQNLIVYRDLSSIDICNPQSDMENATTKVTRTDSGTIENRTLNVYNNLVEHHVWYELNTFVKGFKDVLVKGKSIWE